MDEYLANGSNFGRYASECYASRWDQYVYSYVPTAALKIILEEGLYSGQALLKRPDLLELAAKSRGMSAKEFKKDIEKGLKDPFSRDSLKGPNVVFHLIPESQKLSKKHPTKKHKLTPIKINLTELLADFPDTQIYGMELKPYMEGKSTIKERHHFLNNKEVTEFLAMSPKEMWSRYNDIEDRGLYAPDVPHASIHCDNGIILAKYIQKMTKKASQEKISHTQALKIINDIKSRIKKHQALKEAFDKYNLDINEVDNIPVCFADIDVSARTDHGIIYLNWELLEEGFPKNDHYLAHEMTHYAQQTTGDGPTEGSTDDTYLDNKYEQEGFQVQTEYLSETKGDEVADQYIDDVLEYHEIPNSERTKRKKQLLQLASKSSASKQLKLPEPVLKKTQKELLQEYDEAIARGPQARHERKGKLRTILNQPQQNYVRDQLHQLLQALNKANSVAQTDNPIGMERSKDRIDRKKEMLQLVLDLEK